MRATDDLKTEHGAVKRMLRVLEAASDRLSAGERVSPELFEDAIDFIRNFADRCHHGKEEELLFPALEKAGISRSGGPIGVMLSEHAEGRQFVQSMAAALEGYRKGDPESPKALAQAAKGYAALLAGHIYKEDNILFPMGDRVLSPEADAELVEGFERIESDRIGPGVHERYHEMIDRLEEEMGTAKPA